MPTRNATAVWEGGLATGSGRFKGQTGLSGAYAFNSRFGDAVGSNPEELLAAAEASCFSMALSLGLEQAGFPATSVETRAACTVDKVGEGFKITHMQLAVRAVVPRIDDATFQAIASATTEGCPVSQALRGNVQIDLEAVVSAQG